MGEPQRKSGAGKKAGRVSVFDAANGSSNALLTVEGRASNDGFGTALAANGNHWAASARTRDIGSVSVYKDLVPTPLQVLQGDKREGFGVALGMADLNGDGKPELAVGSSKYDSPARRLRDAGRVQVFDGAGW